MDKKTLVLLLFLAYIFIKGFIVEPNSLEITKYEIQNYSLQGVRVAFLTDFHLRKNDYKRLDKIIKLANEQNADIVLLGGGYTYNHNPKNSMDASILAQKLSLINAPVYTVFGDDDAFAGEEKYKQEFLKNKIRVLDNSNIRTIVKRRYVDIIGLADIKTQEPNIQLAYRKTRLPRILLTHNPDIYYSIIDDTSLILAGHTHGGQIVPPFAPPFSVQSKYGVKFAKGLIKETNNIMIISKGLGTSGIPMRFNCKPEIVIIDFVKYSPNEQTTANKK